MKASRRALPRAVVALAMAAVMAGCGGVSAKNAAESAGDGSPKRGGEVTGVVLSNPIPDSARCGTPTAWIYCEPIYGSLMRYIAKDDKFEPAMAESLESSPDGKVWTLKLRSGITFTDGTPYDADAVSFNWERAKNPALLSPALYWLSQMTWKVVDPLTIEVTLKGPNYNFPWALQYELGMIGSPKAIQEKGDAFGKEPVGAGPFILEQFVENSYLRYTRNPDYIEKGLPYIDKLTLKLIPGDDVRINAFRAGEVNVHRTYIKRDAKALEDAGNNVHRMVVWGGTSLGFNVKDPDLKDTDLRAALMHAFDNAQLTAAIYPGDVAPDSWYAPDSPYREDNVKYPAFDLAEAQRLFDAYLAKTGKASLTLELIGFGTAPVAKQAIEVIGAQFNKIKGLTVNVRPLDNLVLVQRWRESDFQLSYVSSANSQTPESMFRAFSTNGDLNYYGYSNPALDEALETTRRTTNADELAAAWKAVGAELSKADAPVRLFAYEHDMVIGAPTVHGINPVNVGGATWERVWVD
ncbi:ABC transporter substrate-binding protein [Acrocarpospora pleiomorpha]|uniref:ABC transporter substrate-binding protein n=1 Tax=Acrocarpospora pleiomorpha TaxID=90975 RepID=A0A5M3XDZ8_9ACTN|nr:ABC transporter substrate-binding protein [Acrocarpospora pleiomorpha]